MSMMGRIVKRLNQELGDDVPWLKHGGIYAYEDGRILNVGGFAGGYVGVVSEQFILEHTWNELLAHIKTIYKEQMHFNQLKEAGEKIPDWPPDSIKDGYKGSMFLESDTECQLCRMNK